jgi:hypothetical protein
LHSWFTLILTWHLAALLDPEAHISVYEVGCVGTGSPAHSHGAYLTRCLPLLLLPFLLAAFATSTAALGIDAQRVEMQLHA